VVPSPVVVTAIVPTAAHVTVPKMIITLGLGGGSLNGGQDGQQAQAGQA
jgi:hypothetical protein